MCYDYTQIKITFWMSLVTLCETALFLEEEEKEGAAVEEEEEEMQKEKNN